jgi:putative transcriptional regulator
MSSMTEHVDDLIPELVLGTLEDPVRTSVEQHVRRCERCAAEAAVAEEALSLLALALPPQHPHPALRTRVLASIVEEQQALDAQRDSRNRLAPFIERLSNFFDIGVERARALVELATDPSAWTRGPGSGVSLLHVEAGPRFAHADAGLIRMAPGARFPRHRHLGHEYGLILEGGLLDESGAIVRAGETHDLPAGTSHYLTALPDGCLFAAVVEQGIEFIGEKPEGPTDDAS